MCEICDDGQKVEQAGLDVAEKDVLPFVKKECLKLKYPHGPIPYIYSGLMNSCFAYAQVVAFSQRHPNVQNKFYTDNEWMLKFAEVMANHFGIPICPADQVPTNHHEVCVFNTSEK